MPITITRTETPKNLWIIKNEKNEIEVSGEFLGEGAIRTRDTYLMIKFFDLRIIGERIDAINELKNSKFLNTVVSSFLCKEEAWLSAQEHTLKNEIQTVALHIYMNSKLQDNRLKRKRTYR